MKRIFSGVALAAALSTSFATSTQEQPPAPTGDVAIGRLETSTVLQPGQATSRSFTVSIPDADLDDVLQSTVTLYASTGVGSGWSTVLATVSGPAGTASFELYADASDSFADSARIDEGIAGCNIANGLCTSTWMVHFEHIDGQHPVEIDYSLSASTIGPNTTIDVD